MCHFLTPTITITAAAPARPLCANPGRALDSPIRKPQRRFVGPVSVAKDFGRQATSQEVVEVLLVHKHQTSRSMLVRHSSASLQYMLCRQSER